MKQFTHLKLGIKPYDLQRLDAIVKSKRRTNPKISRNGIIRDAIMEYVRSEEAATTESVSIQ